MKVCTLFFTCLHKLRTQRDLRRSKRILLKESANKLMSLAHGPPGTECIFFFLFFFFFFFFLLFFFFFFLILFFLSVM